MGDGMTTTAQRDPDRQGLVLGVQGLSGGVGASCLTAALTVRAATARHRVLAVEASPWGAGLDLLLGVDLDPGPRWTDLVHLRGAPDPALLAELPGEEGWSVLSWGRAVVRPGPAEPWDLARHAAASVDLVVCDLPALGRPEADTWWLACDRIVLVAGDGVDSFAAAGAAADLVPRAAGLVVRRTSGTVDPESTAVALGLPLLSVLGPDDQVPRAVLRGEPVGRSGRLARCADEVLADLLVTRAESSS